MHHIDLLDQLFVRNICLDFNRIIDFNGKCSDKIQLVTLVILYNTLSVKLVIKSLLQNNI